MKFIILTDICLQANGGYKLSAEVLSYTYDFVAGIFSKLILLTKRIFCEKIVLIFLSVHIIFLLAMLASFGYAIVTDGEKYAFWVVMTIGYCFSYIVFNVVFSKYTNRFPKNSVCEPLFPKSDLKKDLLITVSRKGEIYHIQINKREIALDLTQYPFKKAYVLAFLSRNLRYSAVSNKLPLKRLFSKKLRISNTRFNCYVLFVTDNCTKKRQIVRYGVSYVTFFQNLVNKSRYYTYFFSQYSQSQFVNKRVCQINEEIYQAGRINVSMEDFKKQ